MTTPFRLFSDIVCSFSPQLSEQGFRLLCESMREVYFDSGEIIFRKGDPAEGLYFILEGRVGIQKETGFEDKTQIIGLLDPGAPLGERGLLRNMNHGAGAFAVEKTCLGFLSIDVYHQLCKLAPDDGRILLEWLMRRVSRRLEKVSERLAHIL